MGSETSKEITSTANTIITFLESGSSTSSSSISLAKVGLDKNNFAIWNALVIGGIQSQGPARSLLSLKSANSEPRQQRHL